MSSNVSPWMEVLPDLLKSQILGLVTEKPESRHTLDELYHYFHEKDENKKRKVSQGFNIPETGDSAVKRLSDYSISISRKLSEGETIFELPLISFQSPIRKKMNMVLHLLPENGANPILLIVNPTTLIPEMSFIQLDKSIKLCTFLPILGLSTVESKRNIGSLCFWLHDEAVIDASKNDPIICQINLDVIKKHLIKTGKIPATAESQMEQPTQPQGIKPINEAIIQFLTRQFKMVGFNLINYLPSCNENRNSLITNNDHGIVISHKANSINDMVMISAHKGSKEGSMFFFNKNEYNPAYFGFGFKKPILLYPVSDIVSYSFSDIARYVFTINIEVRKADSEDPELVSLSMIDQAYYAVIDEFLKAQNIENNSFAESLREKPSKASAAEAEQTEATAEGDAEADEDEEDDDNYQGGEEEEDSEDDGDVAGEFDSNADDTSGEEKESGDEEEDTTLQRAEEEDEEDP